MRVQQIRSLAVSSSVAFALAACSGGDGGTSAPLIPSPPVTPTPSPTPTPTPTPTPAPGLTTQTAVKIFPGVTASTNFATMALEVPRGPAPTVTNASAGVTVRYDASSGTYLMAFPGAPEAPFYQFGGNTPNATWWNGETLQSNGNAPAVVTVLKPTNPQQQFSYTTLAYYDTGGMGGGSIGWTAFGIPAPAGSVPTAGSAAYQAMVAGVSADAPAWSVRGTATLQFNFASGTLAGHFDPVIYDLLAYGDAGLSLGRYDFSNTVYSSGSTTFSGQLTQPGITGTGSFNGQFTGPAAQELMSTWTAPYLNPDTNAQSTMFGVWVGSK